MKSLDSIIGLKQTPLNFKELLLKLSKLYGCILLLAEKSIISLREELDVVRDYFEFENTLHQKNRLSFNISGVNKAILEYQIRPFTILSLMKNMVQDKH